jgi:single-stranded DNA-binding protein
MNNTITIVGHVGNAPRSISFGDTQNKLAKFSVAVKEFSNSGDEKTLWIDVDAWNGLADRVIKTITKGREVVVTGRLAVSTFHKEEDGIKKEVTKPVIKLSSFHLCGKRPTVVTETPQEAQSEQSA